MKSFIAVVSLAVVAGPLLAQADEREPGDRAGIASQSPTPPVSLTTFFETHGPTDSVMPAASESTAASAGATAQSEQETAKGGSAVTARPRDILGDPDAYEPGYRDPS